VRVAAAALCALAGLSAGCATGYVHSAKTIVRPAAEGNLAEPQQKRWFNPPMALAVPEDAVVRVVGPTMTCTGTLIEDDLVLTAHHCVVERTPAGGFSRRNLAAGDIRVELGGDYLAWGEVKARAIVTPPCGEQGGAGDVAVLVLTRKLVGLSTMTARLDRAPRVGETVDPMGFGRCATSQGGIHRRVRDGGTIRAVSNETMLLDASVCPGDSGGPVVVRGSHEVVGVISLSAMDGDERTRAASIMARIDAFRPVFAHARLIADGLPANELPPLDCK
jgi:V8-like Glu-specific endopeptidase